MGRSDLDRRQRLLTERIEKLLAEEKRLDRRRAELTAREAELEHRAAALVERETEARLAIARLSEKLGRREAALAARERALEPPPPPEETALLAPPARAVEPRAAQGPNGWNLVALDRLVEQRAADFPERIEEWRYYLLYLREFADANGVLPASFGWLVGEAFGDVVGAQPEPATAL